MATFRNTVPTSTAASPRYSGGHPLAVGAVALGVLLVSTGVAAQLPMIGLADAEHRQALLLIWAIALESLIPVVMFWLAAIGFGQAVRRGWFVDLDESMPVTFAVLGMAVLLLLLYVSAWVVGYAGWVLWSVLGVGWALLAWRVGRWFVLQQKQTEKPERGRRWSWGLVLLGLPLGPMIVATTCPPLTLWPTEAYGYDVLTYHLQIPREWLAAGAMTELEHNVYAYLPGLEETVYGWLGVMWGGLPKATYAAMMFHASTAVAVALAIGGMVRRRGAGDFAAWAAAGVFLATPWVLITGAQAYNEAAMIMFAAAALALAWEVACQVRWQTAVCIGVLLGAAALAKLTAVFMLGLPVVVAWLIMLGFGKSAGKSTARARRMAGLFVVVVLAGTATLSPYLLRNAIWADGNPVFPFAGSVFGTAHWNADNLERWRHAHAPQTDDDHASMSPERALWVHGIANCGYGAIGGQPTGDTGHDIARFSREGGVPVLWLAALASLAVCMVRGFGRRSEPWEDRALWMGAAVALGAMLGLQVVFWITLTHLQSRFLMPVLLPAVLAVGLGAAAWRQVRWRLAWAGGMAVLTVVLTWQSIAVLRGSTNDRLFAQSSQHAPVYAYAGLLDALAGQTSASHAEAGRTLLIPGSEPLLYRQGDFDYATVFDRHPLRRIVEQVGEDPQAIAQALYARDYRRVQVNLAEVQRLEATYGWPDAALVHRLVRAWLASSAGRAAGPGVTFELGKNNGRIVVKTLSFADQP